jgi:hypothetical protein
VRARRRPRARRRITTNWAERFADRAKRTPLLVLLSFAAVLISSVVVVSGAVVNGWNWYSNEVQWRDDEYRKLRSLRAGFSLESFKEALGSALFVRPSENRKLVESSFRGRDYWVQAVSDRYGVVQLYAVTSCDLDFKPVFKSIDNPPIVLNETRFSELFDDADADYFISGATANSYLIESFYGGNPSNYKTYAWGINDACPATHTFLELGGGAPKYRGPVSHAADSIKRFRKRAAINTYAETAPFVDLASLRKSFQIGVDRILIRTVP